MTLALDGPSAPRDADRAGWPRAPVADLASSRPAPSLLGAPWNSTPVAYHPRPRDAPPSPSCPTKSGPACASAIRHRGGWRHRRPAPPRSALARGVVATRTHRAVDPTVGLLRPVLAATSCPATPTRRGARRNWRPSDARAPAPTIANMTVRPCEALRSRPLPDATRCGVQNTRTARCHGTRVFPSVQPSQRPDHGMTLAARPP